MLVQRHMITKTICVLRDKYIKQEMSENATYWDINDGHCENFAQMIIKSLSPDGKETNTLFCAVNENFQKNEKWDYKLLDMHWKHVKPLNGLTFEQVNEIQFGLHMWITDGEYHYDAECPEGTKNFFELPIFMRCFKI